VSYKREEGLKGNEEGLLLVTAFLVVDDTVATSALLSFLVVEEAAVRDSPC